MASPVPFAPNNGQEPKDTGPAAVRQAPLEPADLAQCLALDQRCLGGLWTPPQWQSELADPRRPGIGLWNQSKAGPGDEAPTLLAMACGWLVVDELQITLVAVDPAQRRRGLGRRVLLALLLAGQTGGAQRATLEVAAENGAACGLYGSLGFRIAGRRRAYYRNGDDALIQWLELGSAGRFG